MTVYTIRQVSELNPARLGRRVNRLSDSEALELAQRMANTGRSLQVWRGDELLGACTADQDVATSRTASGRRVLGHRCFTTR